MPFHKMNESGQKLWEGVVSAVGDKSLNLSLYLNKYVYVDTVGESPTEAKVFAVEVLGVVENLGSMLENLKNLEQEIDQDTNCKKLGNNVEHIKELVEQGEFWKANNELEQIKSKCRRLKKQIGRLNLPSGEGIPKIKIGTKVVREYSKYLLTYRKLAEKSFELKTKTRLVVGLGAGGTYETGITLLRNYGIPYIPGTALKGIAKHYAVEKLVEGNWFDGNRFKKELFDELFNKETSRVRSKYKKKKESGTEQEFKEDVFGAMEVTMLALEEENPSNEFLSWSIATGGQTLTAEELRQIFGTKNSEGGIVFLDALPLPPNFNDWEILEWDIMNPHYGPYYQNGEPPGDWYNPNPIKFLVVKPETEFLFGLRKSKTCTGNCDDLLGKAEALLKEALKNHGVGAKTALGYGRFK